MFVQFGRACKASVAERAVDMGMAHVGFQKGTRRKAHPATRTRALIRLLAALFAPKLGRAVLPLDMSLQRLLAVKHGLTGLFRARRPVGARHRGFVRADKRWLVQVVDANVPLQRLVLAERAGAGFVIPLAAEPVLALVDGGMAAQAGGRQKGLAALGADILALLAVGALDVLPQMLFFNVGLWALGALEGPVVCV